MAIWTRPPDRVGGVWRAFRHTSRAFPVLWYGGGAITVRQESGRWHREGEDVAQYLSLSADGAWAERCRYAGLRDDVRRLEERRSLWELQVVEHDIADLGTFDRYGACGLVPELAVGGHARAWPLADALRAAGYRGVLSPSAAFDVEGAVNLTLFGERIEHQVHGALPAPGANPRPGLFVVAAELTDAAAPTRYAMHHTCHQDDHHHTFATWRAGRAVSG